MPSLLPGSIIPETMQTSFVVVNGYEHGEIKGVFSNFYTSKIIPFSNNMELLLEMDSMLETYMSSIAYGDLNDFSFETLETISDVLTELHHEHSERLCSFAIKIWFARQSQWKGTVKWLDNEIVSDFKTISELMSFMTNVVSKNVSSNADSVRVG